MSRLADLRSRVNATLTSHRPGPGVPGSSVRRGGPPCARTRAAPARKSRALARIVRCGAERDRNKHGTLPRMGAERSSADDYFETKIVPWNAAFVGFRWSWKPQVSTLLAIVAVKL